MKIEFKIIFLISFLLIDGLNCRRGFRRRHRRIGSYQKVGAFGIFFGLNSFIGYTYFPFIRTSRINRIVYGNTTNEEHFIAVRDGIRISENLSKNKTNEGDRTYFCKKIEDETTAQTCLEPEEDDSFFSFFSDTWDGLCCEDIKSKEYMCCYASLILNGAFSFTNANIFNRSQVVISLLILYNNLSN